MRYGEPGSDVERSWSRRGRAVDSAADRGQHAIDSGYRSAAGYPRLASDRTDLHCRAAGFVAAAAIHPHSAVDSR